jgi:alkaline phosphatase D
VTCEVARDALTADYRIVEYVSQPDAPISTRASFLIEDGRPGAQRL